jgi:hypothetical protein
MTTAEEIEKTIQVVSAAVRLRSRQ